MLHGVPTRPISVDEMFDVSVGPFALYLHVPFCGSLCAYCSFNKRRAHGEMDAYVDAIVHEAALWRAHRAFSAPRVSSVFIGGGTPSFLPASAFVRMLRGVLERFEVGPSTQVSCEANPESIDRDKLRAMKNAGVTRLSIGVQTFDEGQLRRMGRRHRREDIQRSVEQARDVFDEVSIDLMYGQPLQTHAAFVDDLERAIALPITHVSLFPFVYRPDTIIGKRNPRGHGLSGLERLRAMYETALDHLERAGFTQYTTEDFMRGETPCHYQLDVWEPPVKATLGLGAGALSGFGAWTWHDIGNIERYIQTVSADRFPIASGARMSTWERRVEHVLVALHTLAIHPSRFERDTGAPLRRTFGPLLHLAAATGLLERRDDGAWAPTRRGRFAISHAWTGFVLDQLAKAAADTPDSLHGERHLPILETAPTH